MVKSFKLSDQYLIQDRKVDLTLEKHAVGAEREASHSLRRPVEHDPVARSNLKTEPTTYFMEGEGINAMGTHYENGLFSSSLSELFGRKLRLTSNNGLYGHSVGGAASHYEEEEPFQSLEEIEAQTIGNLLPNDDDLLSGVTDGLDYVAQPNTGDDIEDLDFFSSVGGLDLGEDGFLPGQRDSEFSGGSPDNQMGGSFSSVAGEHTYGEHPSRTLFVQNINSNVEGSELQALFEEMIKSRTHYQGITKLDDTSLTEVCQVKLKGSSLLTLGNSGQCKVFSNPKAMGKIIDVATLLGRSTGNQRML